MAMTRRFHVLRDGSIVALESTRLYRLRGQGRILPSSTRFLRDPLQLQRQAKRTRLVRERRAMDAADRLGLRLFIGILAVLLAVVPIFPQIYYAAETYAREATIQQSQDFFFEHQAFLQEVADILIDKEIPELQSRPGGDLTYRKDSIPTGVGPDSDGFDMFSPRQFTMIPLKEMDFFSAEEKQVLAVLPEISSTLFDELFVNKGITFAEDGTILPYLSLTYYIYNEDGSIRGGLERIDFSYIPRNNEDEPMSDRLAEGWYFRYSDSQSILSSYY